MNAKELKVLMIQKDLTQTEIAEAAKVTRQAVSLLCNGHCRSRRVEKILARRLQLPRQIIFPIEPEPMGSRDAA